MKKVSVTCVYKNNTIYNLTVNHKGDLTSLLIHKHLGPEQSPHPTFRDMYKYILAFLKANNMYCGYQEAFGSRWYDIQFINVDDPCIIDKYGLVEGSEK